MEGAVSENTEVILKTATEGAVIYYEVAEGDATPKEPTTSSRVFDETNPIKITKKTTKKLTVKKAKSKKKTLKQLKSGKKYYIRIRAYKTVGKKTVYGAYSSVKTVKVK